MLLQPPNPVNVIGHGSGMRSQHGPSVVVVVVVGGGDVVGGDVVGGAVVLVPPQATSLVSGQSASLSSPGSPHSHSPHRFSCSSHTLPVHLYLQCLHSLGSCVVGGAAVVVVTRL